MFEPYEELDSWSRERIEHEIEAIFNDKKGGLMSEELYRECYDVLVGELMKREDEESVHEAYDRAMKGI